MNPNAIARTVSTERFALYEGLGFDIIHNHIVNINPTGERIEVDFSAIDPDYLVQVAINKAYDAGLAAGEAALQAKLRSLLGVPALAAIED